MGNGAGNTPASAAQVQDPGVHLASGEQVDSCIYDHFSINPRNENILRNIKRKTVELPFSENVCNRLTGHTPLGTFKSFLFNARARIQTQISQEFLRAFPRSAGNDQPCLQGVCLDPGTAQHVSDF